MSKPDFPFLDVKKTALLNWFQVALKAPLVSQNINNNFWLPGRIGRPALPERERERERERENRKTNTAREREIVCIYLFMYV